MKKILIFLFALVFGFGSLNASDYRDAKPENMKVEFIKQVYRDLIKNFHWRDADFYSPELLFLKELYFVTEGWLDYSIIMQGQDIPTTTPDKDIKVTQLKNGNVRASFYAGNAIVDFNIICASNLEKGNGWGDNDRCFIDDIFEYDSETKKFKSLKNFYINSIKNNKDVNKFLNTFKFAN